MGNLRAWTAPARTGRDRSTQPACAKPVDGSRVRTAPERLRRFNDVTRSGTQPIGDRLTANTAVRSILAAAEKDVPRGLSQPLAEAVREAAYNAVD